MQTFRRSSNSRRMSMRAAVPWNILRLLGTLFPLPFLCWALLVTNSVPLTTAEYHSSSTFDEEKNWYQRYAAYPPYCSTPQEMAKRQIPPLAAMAGGDGNSTTTISTQQTTQLVHVTAILRHGARTPWGNTLNCWDRYWQSPDTGVWNCHLTTYLAPPPPARVTQEGAEAGTGEAMFLFEKQYDALLSPAHNVSNFLNGTCQLGQLLLQGYQQEWRNGQALRKAYVYNTQQQNDDDESSNGQSDPRMQLINAASEDAENNVWDHVYYRVDDEARTLLSGQVIFRGVMGPEMDAHFAERREYPVIPLHTADYDRDVVDPNSKICPRLAELYEEARAASKANASKEAQQLRDFQRQVLKPPDSTQDMHAIDCLMTTMCTDRPLPEAVNDYRPNSNDNASTNDTEESDWDKQYGPHRLQRLLTFDTEKYTRMMKANDAEFAKLGMGPLWYEIMQNIHPYIQGVQGVPQQPQPDDNNSNNDTSVLNKLAVFSGHDTTLMPLLVALDENLWNDQEWAPYASMVVLEIHKVVMGTDNEKFPSGFAFRLMYNGKVLTHKITECPPAKDGDLCDVQVLVHRVSGFATLDRDCRRQQNDDDLTSEAAVTMTARTKGILATPGGIAYLVALMATSALMGGTLAAYVLTGGNWLRWRRRQSCRPIPSVERIEEEEDNHHDNDGIMMASPSSRVVVAGSNNEDDPDLY